MVFFFKSIIPKALDHNDVQSSLSTITKHLDNGIWTSVSSLHQGIELIIVCFSFSQTSLVSKFNLMLIEQFLPQFIYLSIFWYCILKFIQYLYAFFIRASKFSWAWMLFFVKVYGYKMLFYFYFPWNISTCQGLKLLTLIILCNFYMMWKS